MKLEGKGELLDCPQCGETIEWGSVEWTIDDMVIRDGYCPDCERYFEQEYKESKWRELDE